MEQNRLINFVKTCLEKHGAVVEHAGEDLFETLMPIELASKMGFSEDQFFSFNSDHRQIPGVEYISYNAEFLERFSSLVDNHGFFTAVACPADIYLKQKGLEKMVSEKISFLNAICRFVQKKELFNYYLLLNFKYTAVSEEKKEEILPVIIDEYNLNSFPAANVLLPEELKVISAGTEIPDKLLKPLPVDQVLSQACKTAKIRINENLTDFVKSLSRRMHRDVERLNEYYRTIVCQIERKIEKKQLGGEEREKEKLRIHAVQLELKRKIFDLQKRYDLKIHAEMINAMRILVPVVSLSYEIQRKQKKRNFTFVWNPLIKDLESPLCESCAKEAGRFSLCDEHLHLVCPHCSAECPDCRKYYCRACYPVSCPRCKGGIL